jgi:hypothetical protein
MITFPKLGNGLKKVCELTVIYDEGGESGNLNEDYGTGVHVREPGGGGEKEQYEKEDDGRR